MEKRRSALSRSKIDQRLQGLTRQSALVPPVRGWIKAIRDALGMSTAQLAKRLGVKQPSVIQLERSEARGSIELATLRRVAEALDCTLVYALVPNKPLETMVRDQARRYVKQRSAPIEHSMLLEDQKVAKNNIEARIDEVIREKNPRLFWD